MPYVKGSWTIFQSHGFTVAVNLNQNLDDPAALRATITGMTGTSDDAVATRPDGNRIGGKMQETSKFDGFNFYLEILFDGGTRGKYYGTFFGLTGILTGITVDSSNNQATWFSDKDFFSSAATL
jgi:hypothetical protein